MHFSGKKITIFIIFYYFLFSLPFLLPGSLTTCYYINKRTFFKNFFFQKTRHQSELLRKMSYNTYRYILLKLTVFELLYFIKMAKGESLEKVIISWLHNADFELPRHLICRCHKFVYQFKRKFDGWEICVFDWLFSFSREVF